MSVLRETLPRATDQQIIGLIDSMNDGLRFTYAAHCMCGDDGIDQSYREALRAVLEEADVRFMSVLNHLKRLHGEQVEDEGSHS